MWILGHYPATRLCMLIPESKRKWGLARYSRKWSKQRMEERRAVGEAELRWRYLWVAAVNRNNVDGGSDSRGKMS